MVAIKVAPFNRYRTLDVAFGIAQAQAEDRITLYTGNDDHIVADLVTPLVVRTGNREVTLRFQGGLLGHWSVWTRGAVKLLERLKLSVSAGAIPPEVLALDSFVTDCNRVVFDVDHDFAGCIPGCHEILRRQGLMTLDRMPRSAREAERRARATASTGSTRPIPSCTTTPSSPPTSTAGGTEVDDLFATHDALAVAELIQHAQARREGTAGRHAGQPARAQRIAERDHRFL